MKSLPLTLASLALATLAIHTTHAQDSKSPLATYFAKDKVVEELIYSRESVHHYSQQAQSNSPIPSRYYLARRQADNFIRMEFESLHKLEKRRALSSCGSVSNNFWQINRSGQLTIYKDLAALRDGTSPRANVEEVNMETVDEVIHLGIQNNAQADFEFDGYDFKFGGRTGSFTHDGKKITGFTWQTEPDAKLQTRTTFGEGFVPPTFPEVIRREIFMGPNAKEPSITNTIKILGIKFSEEPLPEALFSPESATTAKNEVVALHTREGYSWYNRTTGESTPFGRGNQ